MTTPFVYVGAVAPEALQVTITPEQVVAPPGTALDLSTVTACSLRVHGKTSVVFWETTILSQTSNELVVVHEFAADGTDVPVQDKLSIMPHLTVSGGIRRCEKFTLPVVDR